MDLVLDKLTLPLRRDEHGVIRVGDTRVTLDTLVAEFEQGVSAETIIQDYQTLELADVYAVFAFYLRHKPQVEAYLQEQQRLGEELRRQIEAARPSDGLRERLLARRAQKEKQDAAVRGG